MNTNNTEKKMNYYTRHYVYGYYNPLKLNRWGLPTLFYVGEGCRDRWRVHLRDVKKGKVDPGNLHKSNTIKGILQRGSEPIIKILATNLTRKEALHLETFIIEQVGRENLTNKTNGGDGVNGMVHTEETKLRMSEKRKGVPKSEDWKQQASERFLGENNPMHGKPSSQKQKETARELLKNNNPNSNKNSWETSSGKQNIGMWERVDHIYDTWISNGKPSFVKLRRLAGMEQYHMGKLVEKFKSGWNPHEDDEWLKAFKK